MDRHALRRRSHHRGQLNVQDRQSTCIRHDIGSSTPVYTVAVVAQSPLTTTPSPSRPAARRTIVRLGHQPGADGTDETIAAIEAIGDPLDRYARATEEQTRCENAAQHAGQVRALAALAIHELGASYATIAHVTGLTRSRAQQLVEAGRRLRTSRGEPAV